MSGRALGTGRPRSRPARHEPATGSRGSPPRRRGCRPTAVAPGCRQSHGRATRAWARLSLRALLGVGGVGVAERQLGTVADRSDPCVPGADDPGRFGLGPTPRPIRLRFGLLEQPGCLGSCPGKDRLGLSGHLLRPKEAASLPARMHPGSPGQLGHFSCIGSIVGSPGECTCERLNDTWPGSLSTGPFEHRPTSSILATRSPSDLEPRWCACSKGPAP